MPYISIFSAQFPVGEKLNFLKIFFYCILELEVGGECK